MRKTILRIYQTIVVAVLLYIIYFFAQGGVLTFLFGCGIAACMGTWLLFGDEESQPEDPSDLTLY